MTYITGSLHYVVFNCVGSCSYFLKPEEDDIKIILLITSLDNFRILWVTPVILLVFIVEVRGGVGGGPGVVAGDVQALVHSKTERS